MRRGRAVIIFLKLNCDALSCVKFSGSGVEIVSIRFAVYSTLAFQC